MIVLTPPRGFLMFHCTEVVTSKRLRSTRHVPDCQPSVQLRPISSELRTDAEYACAWPLMARPRDKRARDACVHFDPTACNDHLPLTASQPPRGKRASRHRPRWVAGGQRVARPPSRPRGRSPRAWGGSRCARISLYVAQRQGLRFYCKI